MITRHSRHQNSRAQSWDRGPLGIRHAVFFYVSRWDREIDVEADRERIRATLLSQSLEKCGDPGVTVRLLFARLVNLGNHFSDTSAQIAFESPKCQREYLGPWSQVSDRIISLNLIEMTRHCLSQHSDADSIFSFSSGKFPPKADD